MGLCRDSHQLRIVEEVGQIQESVVSSQHFREIAKTEIENGQKLSKNAKNR